MLHFKKIYNYLRTIDNDDVIIQKLVITTGHSQHTLFSLYLQILLYLSLALLTPFFSCVAYSLQSPVRMWFVPRVVVGLLRGGTRGFSSDGRVLSLAGTRPRTQSLALRRWSLEGSR